jgi:predicted transcriptional regulator
LSARRSKLEIMLTVLKAIRDGVDKPTRIMYAASISWNPTQKILSKLVEQGLIIKVMDVSNKKSKRRYTITEKGVAALEYFDNAHKIIPIEHI